MVIKMIEIGTHEFEINPKIGQPMGGYWRYNKFIKGMHDPVFGNILIISSNELTYSLVVLDELILDSKLVEEMKQEIEKRTKIPFKNITIHVNHTHSTSVTVPEPSDDDYPFLLPEDWDVQKMRRLTKERRKGLVKIVSAASEIASQQMNPVKIGYMEGHAEDIGRNRNRPLDGPVDNSVPVLRFESTIGNPPVILANFGTHPTIAPPENCLISGDLVGSTRKTVKDLLGYHTKFIYTTGAAGDVSTRFTRKSSSFAEVDRMGHILGAEIVKTAERITTFEEEINFHVKAEEIELPVRKLPLLNEATQIFQQVKKELEDAQEAKKDLGVIKKLTENLEGASVQKRFASLSKHEKLAFSKEKFLVPLQAVRIGDVKLIFHPFELFSEIALNIKAKNPKTIVIGYSNNWLSYIPTQYAFDENSYETYITLTTPGSYKTFEDAVIKLLRSF